MPSSQGLADVFSFLGKGLQTGADKDLKERQLKINQGMLAVQQKQTQLQEQRDKVSKVLDEKSGRLKQAQGFLTLLNAIGGITIGDQEQLKAINEQWPELKNYWSQEIDKNGKETEKFILHHPDMQKRLSKEQANKLKADKAKKDEWFKQKNLELNILGKRIQQSSLEIAQSGEERSKDKFDLFKETPQSTFKSGGQTKGILPGGGTTDLGSIQKPFMPAQIKTELIKQGESLASLNRIDEMFNKKYTGILKGGIYGRIKSTLGLMGEDEETFRTEVNVLKNLYVNMMSGGTIPVEEWPRWLEAIPDLKDPPERFKAQLNVTRNKTKALIKKYEDAWTPEGKHKGNRTDFPRLPNGDFDLGSMNDKMYKAFKETARIMGWR